MELASYLYVRCAYVRVLMITCTNSMCQNFHCTKKFAEKFFINQHALTKLVKVSPCTHTHLDSNLESQVGNGSVLTDGTQLENSWQKSAALSENEDEY